MKHSTYSFKDLAGGIIHPLYPAGPFQFTGEGVGAINVSMSTERTVHDVAADGSIMVSKIEGRNGQIQIEVQQTSNVHKYLLSLFNFVETAPTPAWAMTTIVMRHMFDGTSHIATGVSFGKIADKHYQAQGQKVQWTLFAADIANLTL